MEINKLFLFRFGALGTVCPLMEGALGHVLDSIFSTRANPAYREFTRRATVIQQGVDQRKVDQLCEVFEAGDWKHEIYDDKQFPFYALKALEQGKLTTEEVATIQLYWSAIEAHGRKNVQVLDLYSERAVQLINQSRGHLLTAVQLNKLFATMEKKSRGQQVLFVVENVESRQQIAAAIKTQTGINLFNTVGQERLIPSAALMQEALNVRFRVQAVQINWVIGPSTSGDTYKNGRNRTHDVAVRFPGVKLYDDTTSGYSAPFYDLTYSGFYHSWLVSGIPTKYRHLYLDIAKEVRTMRLPPEVKEAYWKALIEMEAPAFQVSLGRKNLTFFSDLCFLFSKAVGRDKNAGGEYPQRIAAAVAPVIMETLGRAGKIDFYELYRTVGRSPESTIPSDVYHGFVVWDQAFADSEHYDGKRWKR